MTSSIPRHMIAGEILKLRRNRSVMAFAFLLSVVVIVVMFAYVALQHASNPAHDQPAGGIDGFGRAVKALGLYFGALTGILIGAEAGTADVASGVFRDLVATGRSRLSLFMVRAPAAIIVSLVFIAAAFAVSVAATFVFADGMPTPSAGLILKSAAWIVLANAISVCLAVGIGSLTGSRAVTLTAVIGWEAVATPLLLDASSLGSARDGLLTAALAQLMPVQGRGDIRVATGVAVIVLLVWLAVPMALGAWRTRSQDA
jgi:hypothetical protein